MPAQLNFARTRGGPSLQALFLRVPGVQHCLRIMGFAPLFKRVDEAVYEAKQARRKRVVTRHR